MKINSDRLHLRNYQIADVETVHEYGSVPEFSKYEPWGPNSIEDTRKFVAEAIAQSVTPNRFKYELAICLNQNDRQIGGFGLRREGQTSVVANLGWAINPAYQNKGYCTEAAKSMITFGFKFLGLKVIYATCDVRNAASFRVMEKLGMKRVGHFEKHQLQKGEMRDTYRYELLGI